MVSIQFTNKNGNSITMSNAFPYYLRGTPSGLQSPSVTPQETRGFEQDGVYFYGVLNDKRVVNVNCAIQGASMSDIYTAQRTLANVLNPKLGLGTLRITTDLGTYKIDAYVAVPPEPRKPQDGAYLTRFFDVIFNCPKPDLLSNASTQIKMVGVTGGLTFPITFPITFGTAADGATIEYTGDNPAQMLLDFRVADGGSDVVDPKFTNDDTGEEIELDTTITAGQKILIDTNPDAPTITKIDTDGTETDAWETLVPESRKAITMQLAVGTNNFSFSSASGDPELYLTYNEHFNGI